jgi:hypothetical protein
MQFVMKKIVNFQSEWNLTIHKTRDGLEEPQTWSTDVNVLNKQQWIPDIRCSTMDRPHSRRRGKSDGWSPSQLPRAVTHPLPVYFSSIPNMHLPVTLAVSNLATEKFFEPLDTIQGWSRRHTSFDTQVFHYFIYLDSMLLKTITCTLFQRRRNVRAYADDLYWKMCDED